MHGLFQSDFAARLVPAMNLRRWICIVLLLVAPLQFTWGAVSVYCQHERGIAAKHVGHHVHQHDSSFGSDSSSGDPAKPASIDPDCAGCHANCTLTLPSGAAVDDVTASVRERLTEIPRQPSSAAYPPPYRPQWRFSA